MSVCLGCLKLSASSTVLSPTRARSHPLLEWFARGQSHEWRRRDCCTSAGFVLSTTSSNNTGQRLYVLPPSLGRAERLEGSQDQSNRNIAIVWRSRCHSGISMRQTSQVSGLRELPWVDCRGSSSGWLAQSINANSSRQSDDHWRRGKVARRQRRRSSSAGAPVSRPIGGDDLEAQSPEPWLRKGPDAAAFGIMY
ncbi:hypothetical protein F5883DRAFT_224162 [Diaporthe sp. PMI_573]|nr:hypothetical protein F5883DRAFT_224162 [Diaporthaceae sp. PMI_573]